MSIKNKRLDDIIKGEIKLLQLNGGTIWHDFLKSELRKDCYIQFKESLKPKKKKKVKKKKLKGKGVQKRTTKRAKPSPEEFPDIAGVDMTKEEKMEVLKALKRIGKSLTAENIISALKFFRREKEREMRRRLRQEGLTFEELRRLRQGL